MMNVRWATLPSIPMRMKPKYCYWSVCDGIYGAMMEHCVDTARSAGVFKEFHVFTDRPLEGCECYDAYQFEKTSGLFKLHYLKVGMSRLLTNSSVVTCFAFANAASTAALLPSAQT